MPERLCNYVQDPGERLRLSLHRCVHRLHVGLVDGDLDRVGLPALAVLGHPQRPGFLGLVRTPALQRRDLRLPYSHRRARRHSTAGGADNLAQRHKCRPHNG